MRTQELSGGLVVRTLRPHQKQELDPWSGTKIATCLMAKKRGKKKALSKEQHTIKKPEDGRGHMARNAGGLSQRS